MVKRIIRRFFQVSSMVGASGFFSVCNATEARVAAPVQLEYAQPATQWQQSALPIGNGSMGGMVFGGVESDRIQFNEDTLWSGDERKDRGEFQPFGDLLIMLDENPVVIPQFTKLAYGQHQLACELCSDGKPETVWQQRFELDGTPLVFEVEMAGKSSAPVQSYTITAPGPNKANLAHQPTSWTFEGAEDGQSWTVLDTQQGEEIWSEPFQSKTFTFGNDKSYPHYRLVFRPTKKVTANDQTKKKHPQSFAVGEIRIGSPDKNSVAATGYRRTLLMNEGLQRVVYERDGVHFTREYFASYPDKVLVVRLTADKPGQYTGAVRLRDAHLSVGATNGDQLSFKGKLDNGLGYEAQVAVLHEGGALENAAPGKIRFKGADSVTLILSLGTDYAADITKGWRGKDPHEKIQATVTAAKAQGYQALLKRHKEDFGALFNRVGFVLKGDEEKQALPTDERLSGYRQGAKDNQLETLLFQFGRYLVISSSRPGSLPSNLQGVWNSMWVPPWGSDYHFNINLQMNYWLTGPANLSECREPLLDYLLSQIPGWRMRMEEAFAKKDSRWKTLPRGWTLRTNGNIYGYTGFRYCESANAWLMQDFWEQYAFTQNKTYLRDVAYPAMKTVVEYWEDRMKRLPDGTLVVPDGWSPEHGPEEDGVTFDQELVWDLLNNFIEAGRILEIDQQYQKTAIQMREKLLKPKIGKWGQIQEWMEDKDDPKDNHRHISHLIGLFPGRQISLIETPDLATAARVTLQAKKTAMEGEDPNFWKFTGWSKSWRSALWARLYEPEEAYDLLRELMTYRVNNNMMTECPPLNLDANFGATMAMCEMLLQSQNKELHLLPALPKAWSADGSIFGLRARGGFEVDLMWADGRLTEARIKSLAGNRCRVRCTGTIGSVSGVADKDLQQLESGMAGCSLVEFGTEIGSVYVISPTAN